MKRDKLPFSLRIVQGAIGKRFVIKHYAYGIIKTKYPDMSRIVASTAQQKCRDVFKEAVAFAKAVLANDYLKTQWVKRLGKGKRIFNGIIKAYMLMDKQEREQRVMIGRRIVVRAFAVGSQRSAVSSGQFAVSSDP